MMRAILRPIVLAACVVAAGVARAACVAPGTWVEPRLPDRPLEPAELIHRLAERRVVLLGEAHDSFEHHRWQLQVIAALHGQWPALATQAYLDFLFPIFLQHEKEKPKDQKPTRQHREFLRFVDSQTTWDRAMAQAIAQHLEKRKGAIVVGILGRYHARAFAVPHQLADLGVRDA